MTPTRREGLLASHIRVFQAVSPADISELCKILVSIYSGLLT